MATLPNPNITPVPAAPDPNYPTLTSITVADLVGPLAANRQPNELDIRSDTLRDRVNDLSENMNTISTGEAGGTVLFLPRDGSDPMTGALDMGANLISNLATGAAGTDGVNVDQLLTEVALLAAASVLRDGSQAMTGALDMGGNQINNLADPTAASDALTLGFADGRFQSSGSIDDITQNFVLTGGLIPTAPPTITGLNITIPAVTAYINGTKIVVGSPTVVGPLTPNSTNHIYLLDTGSMTFNITGVPPANSVKIGEADTDPSDITLTYDSRIFHRFICRSIPIWRAF